MVNLNIEQLSRQLVNFCEAQRDARPVRQGLLAKARKELRLLQDTWDLQAHKELSVPWLMATPLEDPTRAVDPQARPEVLTAVATDGSQIYPDRHVEPMIYLLNISQIGFQYGTHEKPTLATQTRVGYNTGNLAADRAMGEVQVNTDLVTAERDEWELSALLDVALASRRSNRPVVALSDGTLIRWMLQRIDPPHLKEQFIARYAAGLAQFRKQQIPLCSYVSMPNSTEVINLLRGLRNEQAEKSPDSFAGLLDRSLYTPFLAPGQRTAVFVSDSHVLREYAGPDRICFFYIRVETPYGDHEIGRVEIPRWVYEDPQLLSLVHAVVVSDCQKGKGYPMILSAAHERAIIRKPDRTLFQKLVERELVKYDLRPRRSRKQASKERPLV